MTMLAVLLMGARPAAAQDAEEPTTQISTSDVFGFPDTAWAGQPVAGASSSYIAYEEGVSATFDTTGLVRGHVVTMWWVIFNHPELCTNGEGGLRCGEPDLLIMGGDEAVEGTVLIAGGHIVGPDGAGHFGSYLATGDTGDTGAVMIEGPGLTNPLGADVHLVLRDHGPLQAGLFVDALTTYGGGGTEAPDGTGTLGDFVCTQPQFAGHEPTLGSQHDQEGEAGEPRPWLWERADYITSIDARTRRRHSGVRSGRTADCRRGSVSAQPVSCGIRSATAS